MAENERLQSICTVMEDTGLEINAVGETLASNLHGHSIAEGQNNDDNIHHVLNHVPQDHYTGVSVVYNENNCESQLSGSCDDITVDSDVRLACLSDPSVAVAQQTLAIGEDQEETGYTFIGDAELQNFNSDAEAFNYNPQTYAAESEDQQILEETNGRLMESLGNSVAADEAITNESICQPVFTLVPSTSEAEAPLGSSSNPIRIIQQGNQYMPLQNLSPDQLSQIMQVVQQQQLLRSTTASGQSSVLYNPQTQTKIVYRVVYPAQLQSELSNKQEDSSLLTAKVEGAGGKRTYQKRKIIDDPEIAAKQNKELKKKHRPRTRSGRVSKPPQYMVKDYKHIHPVDYDEDYDDSDGGYSDFKQSSSDELDPDGLGRKKPKDDNHISFGNVKPKKYKCEVCDKSYIGKGGLARHFRLNPNHGKADEDQGTSELGDSYYSSDSFQSTSIGSSVPATGQSAVVTNNVVATSFESAIARTEEEISELVDGNDNEASDVSKISAPTDEPAMSSEQIHDDNSNPLPDEEEQSIDATDVIKPPACVKPRRAKRGRPPTHQQGERRKQRLIEVVRQCSDEELMEVVMPRLATSVTPWEFLLMKTEKRRKPDISEIIQEFETLQKQIRAYVQNKLISVTDAEKDSENSENPDGGKSLFSVQDVKNKLKFNRNLIEVTSEEVAACLKLSVGKYKIKEEPEFPERQYKLFMTNPSTSANITQTTKRTVELVSPDQMIPLPPRKRLRLTEATSLLDAANLEPATVAANCNGAAAEPIVTFSTVIEPQSFSMNNLSSLTECKPLISTDSKSVLLTNGSAKSVQTLTVLKTEPAVSSVSPIVSVNSLTMNSPSKPILNVFDDLSRTFRIESDANGSMVLVAASDPAESSHYADGLNGDIFVKSNPDTGFSDREQIYFPASYNGENDPNQVLCTFAAEGGGSENGSDNMQGVQLMSLNNCGEGDEDKTQQQLIEDSNCIENAEAAYVMEPQEIHLDENAQYIETEDGLIIVRNPDGTIQIHGQITHPISLESVQALFDSQSVLEN